MKITKAKYNWLVAQYNYRKNKEEIIEISDEEYQRLTNNSSIIDDEIIDESIYFEKIICNDHGNTWNDVDIQDLSALNEINNNAYTICGNELLGINKLYYAYAKYSNDTYKEITPQIKYHLDKNIGILKSTGVSRLTYYPPESIDEDTIDLQIIGEYNGYVFNWKKIKLYRNLETYYAHTDIVRFSLFLNDLPEISINTPGAFYAVENTTRDYPVKTIKIYFWDGYSYEHPISAADAQFINILNGNKRIVFGQSTSGIFCAYLVDIRMRFITTNIIQIEDNQYDLNNGTCISNEHGQQLQQLNIAIENDYIKILSR